jgi:hypothetical protein
MSWRARFDAAAGRRPWTIARVSHGAQGLQLVLDDAAKGASETRLDWQGVRRVIAYKADALTVDDLRLRFETETGHLDLSEDIGGWRALLDALPQYLPGCWSSEQVLAGVVQPPFAANGTVIYERRKGPSGLTSESTRRSAL